MAINPTYTSTTVAHQGISVTVPHTASAILTSTNMTGGSGPSQSMLPPGFVSGGCPQHHQRGHLIGNQLGGSGSDWGNLVTLTEGSNHPVMYEFERMVYQFVRSRHGDQFNYCVTACYAATNYLNAPQAPGGATRGAASNPYCPPPCPESLVIEFFYMNNGARVYPISVSAFTANGFGEIAGPVHILNGVYKFHRGSPLHVANQCWAS